MAKEILLNYLIEKSNIDPSIIYSRKFYISQWFYDEEQSHTKVSENFKSYYLFEWNKVFENNSLTRYFLFISFYNFFNSIYSSYYSIITMIVRYISIERPLFKSFDSLLKHILNSLNEPHAIIRSKALKAISMIVEVDHNILSDVRKLKLINFYIFFLFFYLGNSTKFCNSKIFRPIYFS